VGRILEHDAGCKQLGPDAVGGGEIPPRLGRSALRDQRIDGARLGRGLRLHTTLQEFLGAPAKQAEHRGKRP
jgi:hypothetical protein